MKNSKAATKGIALFPPFHLQTNENGIENWQKKSNKKWKYAPNGRAAIFHIVRALAIKKILIPSYLCASVLEGLEAANVEVYFLDVEPNQVMPSPAGLEKKLSEAQYDAVLWASLYGQPSELSQIENICRIHSVKLIDDGAQAFGATCDDRFVGEFGDAGLFSFSPGKATAGPMGAFFWTSVEYSFQARHHALFHQLKYWDFFNNRYHHKKNFGLGWLLSRMASFFTQKKFYYFDAQEDFEKSVIGGVLQRELAVTTLDLRRKRFNELRNLFANDNDIEVFETDIVRSHPHKLVLIFKQTKAAQRFRSHLTRHKIRFGQGYKSLSNDCANAWALQGRILELPILDQQDLWDHLMQAVQSYRRENSASHISIN